MKAGTKILICEKGLNDKMYRCVNVHECTEWSAFKWHLFNKTVSFSDGNEMTTAFTKYIKRTYPMENEMIFNIA